MFGINFSGSLCVKLGVAVEKSTWLKDMIEVLALVSE